MAQPVSQTRIISLVKDKEKSLGKWLKSLNIFAKITNFIEYCKSKTLHNKCSINILYLKKFAS